MEEVSPSLVGTVFKILGKEVSVRVETPEGIRVLECYLRGRLFDSAEGAFQNQIAVGDEVELDAIRDTRGVIHRVLPRSRALVRLGPGRKAKLQVLAANVDRIVIVSALFDPPYKTGLIDRYLVIAHQAEISPALAVNKIDLAGETTRRKAEGALAIYRSLGYPLIWTSARSGAGIPELRSLLANRRSVLVGHSGVGKSKLAAAIQPGIRLSSGDVDRHGRGRHTTTASTLFSLDSGGELVDTPGVRELSIRHVKREELERSFIELRPFLGECRFTSCSHIPEPGCAVKNAVDAGAIARERYMSYERLYHELSA
ncbi:MAG: ribosome small subunit-dependent GTPase A [Vicinamibacteria bacterium]